MTISKTKAAVLAVLATGLLSVTTVVAQDQGEKTTPGQMPMMNSDQMQDMQRGGMGGMMGMMGMMSAMTDMMQTCNKMMQAALPQEEPAAQPEKDG